MQSKVIKFVCVLILNSFSITYSRDQRVQLRTDLCYSTVDDVQFIHTKECNCDLSPFWSSGEILDIVNCL